MWKRTCFCHRSKAQGLDASRPDGNNVQRRVINLNKAVSLSKQASLEAKKDKRTALSKIKEAAQTDAQVQRQVDDMKTQLGIMHQLENQLKAKSVFINTLQVKLDQANGLISSDRC